MRRTSFGSSSTIPEAVETLAAVCTRRITCRLCDSTNLQTVLVLEPTPPANNFVTAAEVVVPQQAFPLDVALCADCAHVQLLHVVDPRLLFENYVYVSGTSPVFVEHFKSYAVDVGSRVQVRADDLVVDIGSNDGTLLRCFLDLGCRVLGIDPARSIAEAATASGIETLAAFFTPALAAQVRESHGSAKVVTANNVFAHIDDLRAVLDGVRALLAPDGVFVFEVSYLVDVFEKTLFDTIYHEHLSYHDVGPLVGFFAANGMQMFDAQRVGSHGGSLRGFAQLAGGPRVVQPGLGALVRLEKDLGLDRRMTFDNFGTRINGLRDALTTVLSDFKGRGESVAGFGAPAKATTLLHHFKMGADVLDYIIDDSPLKQGLFTPGQHIPVLPAVVLESRPTDNLLVLAWNFADSIIAKNVAFTEGGGRFIVPLPEIVLHGGATR